jgi:hypothetical protein
LKREAAKPLIDALAAAVEAGEGAAHDTALAGADLP